MGKWFRKNEKPAVIVIVTVSVVCIICWFILEMCDKI